MPPDESKTLGGRPILPTLEWMVGRFEVRQHVAVDRSRVDPIARAQGITLLPTMFGLIRMSLVHAAKGTLVNNWHYREGLWGAGLGPPDTMARPLAVTDDADNFRYGPHRQFNIQFVSRLVSRRMSVSNEDHVGARLVDRQVGLVERARLPRLARVQIRHLDRNRLAGQLRLLAGPDIIGALDHHHNDSIPVLVEGGHYFRIETCSVF